MRGNSQRAWPGAEFFIVEGAGQAYFPSPGILDPTHLCDRRFRGEDMTAKERIYLFDTTPATARRRPACDFSVRRTRSPLPAMLDAFGIDYVEGGLSGRQPERHPVL